jgi:hypothetical protein
MTKYQYYIIRLTIDTLKGTNVPVGIVIVNDKNEEKYKIIGDFDWPKKIDVKYQSVCKTLDGFLMNKKQYLKYISDPFKYTGPFTTFDDSEFEALCKMFGATVLGDKA